MQSAEDVMISPKRARNPSKISSTRGGGVCCGGEWGEWCTVGWAGTGCSASFPRNLRRLFLGLLFPQYCRLPSAKKGFTSNRVAGFLGNRGAGVGKGSLDWWFLVWLMGRFLMSKLIFKIYLTNKNYLKTIWLMFAIWGFKRWCLWIRIFWILKYFYFNLYIWNSSSIF